MKKVSIWAGAVLLVALLLAAFPAGASTQAAPAAESGQHWQLPGGDGFFSGQDLLLLKAYALQTGKLSADGLDMTAVLLNGHRLSAMKPLSLAALAGISPCETVVLTPGQTLPVEKGTAVLGSGSVKNGAFAPENTGKALLLQNGRLVTVAVCEAPLTFTAPEAGLLIDPGKKVPLEAALNHPVRRGVTYTSSDPLVAKVDENGMITALRDGTATVTATLSDGQTVSRAVRVATTVKQLSLSAESMKVKHGGGVKVLGVQVLPGDTTEPLVWTSSDPSIATVDENGVVTGLSDGYVTVSCTAQYSGISASCRVKVCNLIQVALTYDDGPSADYTMRLLDVLQEHGVTATFFFVGNRIYTAPDAVRRIAAEGHELGYHTWSHQFFYNMDADQIRADYRHFQTVLESVCGQTATVFRSPGGTVTGAALQNIPLPHIYWSEDTRDWATRDTEKVKAAILAGLKDGAIILVHDIHYTTYTGTVAALEEIRAQDLDVEFLTVTELLSRNGKAPTSGRTYYNG